jgi:DNA-binding IscR family transcriptional regulator
MSNKVLNLVWSCEHFGTKDGKELLVMLALADWANDDGKAWPSVAQLCKRARISERHWYRIRPKLVKAGFIQITEKGGPVRNNRNDRRSNLYRIVLGKLQSSKKRNDPDGMTTSKASHDPDTVSASSVLNDPDIRVERP